MKIIKILKREEEVDQKSYILWTWPGPILLAFLLFLGTEQGDRFMGKYLMDMSGALLAGAFLFFLLMLIFVIFLSGRRFVMFQQSGYLALLMLLIPAYFIIWIYLAFRKDLYYLKESREK